MAKNKLKDSDIAEVEVVGVEKPIEPEILPEPIKPAITFEQWWATKSLPEKHKAVIQKHMEKKGFIESQSFEQGLKDFGL